MEATHEQDDAPDRDVNFGDAQLNVSDLLAALSRCEITHSETDADIARECAATARRSVERVLNIAPQMPHQDAVARLLYHSWADVGMRVGLPSYEHLTASERGFVSAAKMTDIAGWIARQVTVYCIRVCISGPNQVYGWLHAGSDLDAVEIDDNATAPSQASAVKRILSWPTCELAQRYCDKLVPGEICELTVEQLWVACRA
jgi:hypothetical protein